MILSRDVVRPGSNVTLDFPLLLDRVSPPLAGLVIRSGGSLVFSSAAPLASLTAGFVYIGEGGALVIGSEECPFSGRAELVLTGRPGELELPDIGGKVLVVARGGRLEVHGEEKVAWTRLEGSVAPAEGHREIRLQGDVTSWRPGWWR